MKKEPNCVPILLGLMQNSVYLSYTVNLSGPVYRYQPDTDRDLPIIEAIQAVLEINLGYGFGKLFKTMR